MRITHPDTGQVADVPEETYELVYKSRRWEPVPAEEPLPRPAVDPLPDVDAMTIPEVHAFLDAHPERAADVLEVEQGGKQRKTLIAELEERAGLGTGTADAATPTDPADEADTTTTAEENS